MQILTSFGNQHVGIGNAKLWRSGSKPMQGPNINGFVSEWNIGLKVEGPVILSFLKYFFNIQRSCLILEGTV